MQMNKVLKGLLAVSAAAAMFGAAGVRAQSADTKGANQPATPAAATMRQDMGKDQKSMGTDQVGGSGAAGASAAAQAPMAAPGTLSKSDQKILERMAQANMAEVEAGKMAQSKSQDEQVKSFAQQMIDDHGKALADVQQLAQQKGVTLPTEPDAKHKAMAAKLDKMSGAAFDKAYMAQAGVSDHKKVHAMLMKDEKHAKDADVKALAAKMAPVVEQHLKSAEQMHMAKSGTKSGK